MAISVKGQAYKSRKDKRVTILTYIGVAIGGLLIIYFLQSDFSISFVLLLVCVVAVLYKRRSTIEDNDNYLLSKKLERKLSKLDDSYHIIYNPKFKDKSYYIGCSGLVIGSGGIFIIDINDKLIQLSGKEDDKKLQLIEGDAKDKIPNPLKEDNLTLKIAKVLEDNKIEGSICKVLLYCNKDAKIDVKSKRIFRTYNQLFNYLQTYNEGEYLTNDEIETIYSNLVEDMSNYE
ncbi:MAG: hypothetical protein PHH04_01680 [Thomasclavelia sp.]|nr:hypothetical protein [Thomasclavelia sp.]